jgi:hypothetical protein
MRPQLSIEIISFFFSKNFNFETLKLVFSKFSFILPVFIDQINILEDNLHELTKSLLEKFISKCFKFSKLKYLEKKNEIISIEKKIKKRKIKKSRIMI